MTLCKKCNLTGNVILRKVDSYCETCFFTNTNHKFRACIGKNKILSSNEKVLICLLSGPSSVVLLDLIHNGLAQDSHKKLRITPFFMHLKGYDNDEKSLKIANSVVDMCKDYGFDIYISSLADCIHSDCPLPESNTLPTVTSNTEEKFQKLLNSMPQTAQNDFLIKIKRKMFIRFAEKLDCRFIFTPETTTTLAINLLSNIATGRGSQVQNDIGFSDSRHNSIKILRPMKDISEEELIQYIKLKGLKELDTQDMEGNSLQSVIKSFVTDLQENFPATISTICKTADKIGIKEQTKKSSKCIICDSDLDRKSSKLSALEATNYSRMISLLPPQNRSHDDFSDNVALSSSLFPNIHTSLCYGCSRNYSEMSNCELPSCIQNKLHE